MTTKCALWARVSTTDQHTANQLDTLRAWAKARGLEVGAEYITEDSAWADGSKGSKGKAFDAAREGLLNGARLGQYQVVLCWAIDRLSRKGIEDTLAAMRRLYQAGADIWSHQEGWLETADPAMRELLVSFLAWVAQQESSRRSARIRAGLARRSASGLPIGRQAGAKDKRPRKRSGYYAAAERRREENKPPTAA